MNKNWKKITLKDISQKIQYGYTSSASNEKVGPKFLRITDIVPELINWDKVPYCKISEKEAEKYLLTDGDILIARTGATTGYAKQIWNKRNVIFASYLVRIQLIDEVCKKFIGKIIQSDDYKHYIKQHIGGAAQPNANAHILTSFPLILPPIETQRKIAAILSAYDDLIENNTRRIQILEEMAQRIYREWFVHFRFPGHEHVKMVDSELGRIPEGWEVKKIGDVAKVGRGSSPRPIKDYKYFKDGSIPWIKIADATKSGKYLFDTKQKVNDYGASFSRLLPKGSLIVATSGTLGFAQLLGVAGCVHDGWLYLYEYKGNLNPYFLYYVIDEKREYFEGLSYGAAIQNINTFILSETKFIKPPNDTLNKFQNIIISIDDQLINLTKKNKLLRQTRDLLLPKLTSGKIDVSDLEIETRNLGNDF